MPGKCGWSWPCDQKPTERRQLCWYCPTHAAVVDENRAALIKDRAAAWERLEEIRASLDDALAEAVREGWTSIDDVEIRGGLL